MARWTQPLLLTTSALLSLSSISTAHPANNHAIYPKHAEIPPVLPHNAFKRQDAPATEITPVPEVKQAEDVSQPTATVPFEAHIPAEDTNDWRSVKCEADGVKDHTLYGPDPWKNVDAGDAWSAVIEGWKMNITGGREQKHFSNNVSNFFHGPQDMFCETFSDEGSGCEDLNLQCHSTSVPAGYFILHSFENIFAMHSNIWNAVGDAVRDNDIGTIASEFGKVPPKEGGLATSILIDIALMVWGIVMGPAWNKLIGPKFSDSTNAGTLKDTTNDLVKNSLTLTKDILNGRAQDQLGVQNGLTAQMQGLTEGWKDGVLATQKWLFGGSEEGYNQLGAMISDASMFGDNWLLDRGDHAKQVKRAINAFLIPMAWQYSPDVVIPFIAESDVACDQDPGWNKEATFTTMFQHWIDDGALKDGRFCFNGKSYWLLGGRDRNTNCDSKSGDADCGGFALPPGWQSLKDKKFTDISLDNVIIGSLNSKAANGGKNGFKLDLGDEPSREVLDSLAGSGIEAPGVFNIPICSMDEVIENYYLWYGNSREDMTNFPCNV
ncbi:hypothetical protein H9Q69_003283 [Fusarium xylarioides]|nr:hypothetical protein H9Q70_007814 [Fusarium xylarioides]KAG5779755.1 hypothetical protein H9Q73_006612 [Fusarium xylarioides]KAG5797687.1 hypothetical protein H9Q69_003283 [Fusarium xylarioides]